MLTSARRRTRNVSTTFRARRPFVLGTLERGTPKPVPDFCSTSDQVEEINALTKRIHVLSKSVRMKGFILAAMATWAMRSRRRSTDGRRRDPGAGEHSALFGDKTLKDLIVVDAGAGGGEYHHGAIGLRRQLVERRLPDYRPVGHRGGATDLNETLGAQGFKSQYGSIRISEKQNEMALCARRDADRRRDHGGELLRPALMEQSQYEGAPTAAALQQMWRSTRKIAQAMADPNLQQQAQQNPQMAQQMMGQAQAQKQKIAQTATIEQSIQFLRGQKMLSSRWTSRRTRRSSRRGCGSEESARPIDGTMGQPPQFCQHDQDGSFNSAPFAGDFAEIAQKPYCARARY